MRFIHLHSLETLLRLVKQESKIIIKPYPEFTETKSNSVIVSKL